MRPILILAMFAIVGCSQPRSVAPEPEFYTITEHAVVQETNSSLQRDEYTLTYGPETLKVRYTDSQTSSAKAGDFPGSGLHMHSWYSNPDLSQVPPAGTKIRACLLNPQRDSQGDLVIARQPTPEACMARIGDTLRYEPSPNGPALFTYVAFEIVSEQSR